MSRCVPFFAILGLGLPAFAQAPPDDAMAELQALLNTPINVSSNRAVTIFQSPSTVSILDRDTIEQYGFQTLAEALETVSGVYITQPLWNRNLPTLRGVMQESYANRVLLLINGVASWNTLTGDGFLSRVVIEDVERIEVLKGPASVLYGTNAYAGAINIVLRKGSETTTRAHVGAQDQGGYRLGASHFQQLGGQWSFLVSAHGQHDATETRWMKFADQPVREIEAAPEYAFAEQFHGKNTNFLLEGHGLTVQANAFHEESPWFGAANRQTYGGGTAWENNGHFFHLRYQYQAASSLLLTYAGLYDATSKQSPVSLTDATFAGTVTAGIGLRQRGHRMTHMLSGSWDITPHFNWELGATTETRVNDYYQQYDNRTGATLGTSTTGMTGESNLKDVSLKEDSVFTQVGYKNGPWNVVLGTRYTKNDAFGNNTSSRLTLVYGLSDTSSLKLIYGQSFRAPAFLEQRIRFGSIWGNPNLKPETSDSFELAYMASFGNMFIQVIGFSSSYKNKAYRSAYFGNFPDAGTPPASRRFYQNAPEFKGRGLELELKYHNSRLFDAFLTLDYTTGNNGDEITDLVGTTRVLVGYNYKMVPKFAATGGISKSLSGFTGSVLVNYQSGCEGPLGPVDYLGRTWATIPAWTSVDLNVSYSHKMGHVKIKHSAALKNAGDQERWSPEATRRNVNRIPFMEGRKGLYSLSLTF